MKDDTVIKAIKDLLLHIGILILLIVLVIFNTISFFKEKKLSTVDNNASTSELYTENDDFTEELTDDVDESETEFTEEDEDTEEKTTEFKNEELKGEWFDTNTDDMKMLEESTGPDVDSNYISH